MLVLGIYAMTLNRVQRVDSGARFELASLGLQPSALPLDHPEMGGVGYGIRTRVSGVKVRSPRPLADNPTQNLGRATLSEMRLGVAGENRTHDTKVHSLGRQTAGDGHTQAHSREGHDRVMSWSSLRESNPHPLLGRQRC